MKQKYLLLSIIVFELIVGCSKQTERGNFIIEKEIKNSISMILVAKNISREDAMKSPAKLKRKGAELMLYWIGDKNLFNSLEVGDNVTVKLKDSKMDGKNVSIIMQSDPPHAIAEDVIVNSN